MSPAEPDSLSVLRVIFAFVVVFGLLGALGFGLKYISRSGIKFAKISGAPRRLELIESLPLDVRRRLVIVRCDDKEHLLLLGHERDIVVSENITTKQNN